MANWIQGAISHPGALHQQMGVPQGQAIPARRLQTAAGAPGRLDQRARLAETLKGMSHPGAPNRSALMQQIGGPHAV